MAPGPSAPADQAAPPTGPKHRLGVMVMCAAAFLVILMNPADDEKATEPSRPPQAAPAGASAGAPTPPVEKREGSALKHLPRSRPVRLLIPKISVDAPFTDLAILPSGQLEAPPPDDTNLVGWHAKGPSPGEIGTSIIAGHVDTKTSPAVFVGLSELEKGDVFHVKRADGRKASFVIDHVETFEKDRFPNDRVYGDTGQAQVRLITCAGDYDRQAKDYTENLVVFAHLI